MARSVALAEGRGAEDARVSAGDGPGQPGGAGRALAHRGTTNRNARGGTVERYRRRVWLVETFRADVDYIGPLGQRRHACRCYRCGVLLTVDTVTADRIVPGIRGGTYRRNNLRPACGCCNSETGGRTRRSIKPATVICYVEV